MTAETEKLVRMANQIATEFTHQQGDNAARATWDHLRHFWDPRMRDGIIAVLDAGGAGLNAVAREAVTLLRTAVERQPQTRATDFGVDADGNTAGDAG